MNLKELSLRELISGFKSKDFSSYEITKAYLSAIKEDTTNSFISVNEDALRLAKAADRAREKGEVSDLAGIPIAIKDNLVTEGIATTAASKMLKDYFPPYTATAVKKLVECGMVILGKTNCDEFAMGSSNENSAFGPVKNPRDRVRVAGGSSGGSAAAVANFLTPIALGSDTGGSVRLPAAFCGVVGLKPTYGRVSRYGLIAMASSLDQVGILSRTPWDCARLLEVISGFDECDETSSNREVDRYSKEVGRPMKKILVGLPKEYFSEYADLDLQRLIEEKIREFRLLSHVEFKEVSLPRTRYALAMYYIIAPSEVSANLARYDGLRYGLRTAARGSLEELYAANRSAGLGPEVQRRIMLGTYALSAGYFDAYYAQASRARRILRDDFMKVFTDIDVLLTPAAPTPAFKLGEKRNDPLAMYLSDIFMVSANLAGIPALTFPIGEARALPVGLQLMGPAWSEAKLLRTAQYLMRPCELS